MSEHTDTRATLGCVPVEDKEALELAFVHARTLEAELAALRATVESAREHLTDALHKSRGIVGADSDWASSPFEKAVAVALAALPPEAGKPKCPTCGGSGDSDRYDLSDSGSGRLEACPACNGSGEVTVQPESGESLATHCYDRTGFCRCGKWHLEPLVTKEPKP